MFAGGGGSSSRRYRYADTDGSAGSNIDRPEAPESAKAEPSPEAGESCARLGFTTMLSSPEPSVVAKITVGDRLRIALQLEGEVEIVAALSAQEELAGTVTTRLAELIPCLRAGWQYVATVMSIDGGAVRLEIHHA